MIFDVVLVGVDGDAAVDGGGTCRGERRKGPVRGKTDASCTVWMVVCVDRKSVV